MKQSIYFSLLLLLIVVSCQSVFAQARDRSIVQFFKLLDQSPRDGRLSATEIYNYALQFQSHHPDDDGIPLGVRSVSEIPDSFLKRVLPALDKGAQRKPSSLKAKFSDASQWYFTFDDFVRTINRWENATSVSASSPAAEMCGDEAPQQIHLNLGNSTQDITIMWTTMHRDFNPEAPYVQYSAQPDLDSLKKNTVRGSSHTYNVGPDGFHGWIHRVTIKDLNPYQDYYYRVGTDKPLNQTAGAAGGCWSSIIHFRTRSADPALERKNPACIALYGDMGTWAPLGAAVADTVFTDHRKTRPFDLILHIGDIAYGGTGSEVELQFIWDVFMRQIQPFASEVPYVQGVGNHEKYYNFTSYKSRFYSKGVDDFSADGSAPMRNFAYSFDMAGIHFIHMTTEEYVVNYAPGSKQYKWLERDLQQAAANRAAVPWIVLMGHRPMYSSDKSTDSGHFQEYIEPLMLRYGVDLGVYGHMHEYERTLPMANKTQINLEGVSDDRRVYKDVKLPVHLTVGTAGAMISEEFIDPKPEWSVVHFQDYGYLRLQTADSARQLNFQFVQMNGPGVPGKVLDEFVMIKSL